MIFFGLLGLLVQINIGRLILTLKPLHIALIILVPSGAALFRCVATCRKRVSLISVLLPEPETPVTQVSSPSGISTSRPCRCNG